MSTRYDPISGEDLYAAALERIRRLEEQVAELLKAQPNCICEADCGMKDPETTQRMMDKILFGEGHA